MIENNSLIIAVDHGYGNIKTVNTIFPSGITACTGEPAFAQDKLYWVGRWYIIGEGHKEFLDDKTKDEDYLILTMAAIAKELKLRGLTEARVHLAVGVPLGWMGEQKDSFRRYFLRFPELDFTFNGVDYSVELTGVDVFPQGYAVVADRLHDFTGLNMLCDIGNGTMSCMFINNRLPVSGKIFMEKFGTYQCTLAVQEALMSQLHLSVDNSMIEQVLCTGYAELSDRVMEVIHATAREYVRGILRRLREHGYNPELIKLRLMGGGACLIKNYGEYDEKTVFFNDDIRSLNMWLEDGNP